MAEYLGRSAVLKFASITFGRFTTIDTDENVDLVDKSAGSDTHDSVLAGLTKGQFSLNSNHNAGDTATWNGVAPGTEGTIEYAPEGTLPGKPKYSVVAMVQNRQRKQGYNDITRFSVTFKLQADVAATAY